MNMTEIEARGKIKYRIANEMRKAGENKEEYEDLEIAIQALKEIREYRELGTVEELKALKEKNVSYKVIEHETMNFIHWQCGNCGAEFYSGQTFCDDCGHPADWGDLLDWE